MAVASFYGETHAHATNRAVISRTVQIPLGRGELARLRVAGVHRPDGLDQEDFHLLVRARAMLDAARDDEQLARVEHDVAISQLNRQAPLQDEEEIVGV